MENYQTPASDSVPLSPTAPPGPPPIPVSSGFSGSIKSQEDLLIAIDELNFFLEHNSEVKDSNFELVSPLHYLQNIAVSTTGSIAGLAQGTSHSAAGMTVRLAAATATNAIEHGLLPALNNKHQKQRAESFKQKLENHPTLKEKHFSPDIIPGIVTSYIATALETDIAIDIPTRSRALEAISRSYLSGLAKLGPLSRLALMGGAGTSSDPLDLYAQKFSQVNHQLDITKKLMAEAKLRGEADTRAVKSAVDWSLSAVECSLLKYRDQKDVRQYIEETYLPELEELAPERVADFESRLEMLTTFDKIKTSNLPPSALQKAKDKVLAIFGKTPEPKQVQTPQPAKSNPSSSMDFGR